MKRFIVFTAIFALVAGSLFAAAAPVVKEKPAATTDITTYTQEMSTDNYPGVLVPGSMSGTNAFLSDISLFSNIALLEVVYGTPIGLVTLKTDLGTIGLSVAPGEIGDFPECPEIHQFTPSDVLGLLYGNKIGSMDIGLGVLYGVDIFNYENKDLSGYTPPGNRDFRNNFDQYLSLKGGVGIDALDLGVAVTMQNNSKKTNYYSGVNWSSDQLYSTTSWQLDVSGRLALANDFTAAATISWLTAQDDATYLDNANNYTNRWNNSALTLDAVLGKDIKAGETLTVKIAGGLNIGGDYVGEYNYVDHLDASNSYQGSIYGGDSDRSQYGWWYIPFNVGVEAKLNETWTLNAGSSATIVAFDNYLDKYNTSRLPDMDKVVDRFTRDNFNVSPELSYAIGVTGKIGDLRLDLYMNPMILVNGPFFVSGNTTGPMNMAVALVYDWN